MCMKSAATSVPFLKLPPQAPAPLGPSLVEAPKSFLPTVAGNDAVPVPRAPKSGRRRLWQLPAHLLCPVVGTCLSVAELRRIARRASIDEAGVDDYVLHSYAVGEAGKGEALAKVLHKALEAKYQRNVRQFEALADDTARRAYWSAAMRSGDVAGAFWAVLSSATATTELNDRAYRDVHMLSHQIGAGQRVDLQQLASTQRDATDMRERLNALRDRHQKDLDARDQRIAGQEAELAALRTSLASAHERLAAHGDGNPAARWQEEIRQLRAEAEKQRLRANGLADSVREARAQEACRQAALNRMQEQLAATEGALQALLGDASRDGANAGCALPDLGGRCLLCVGGVVNHADQYRALVARCNGRLDYHDGGLEGRVAQLSSLIGQADGVICPSDHVSHSAYYEVKKLCKQLGKPCALLTSSGLGSFTRAVKAIAPYIEGKGEATLFAV